METDDAGEPCQTAGVDGERKTLMRLQSRSARLVKSHKTVEQRAESRCAFPPQHISFHTRRSFLSDGIRLSAFAALGNGLLHAAGSEAKTAAIVRTLDVLSIRGINYYPAQTPWAGLWTKTPPEVIERDMALMGSMHVNAVRTFLPCGDGTHFAQLTDAGGHVSPPYIEKIEQFLTAAWREGIRTIFCFDFDEKTLKQPEVWRTAVAEIAARGRDDGRVLMWDLMNEPEGPNWSPACQAYLKAALPCLKELDGQHLTTVGIGWEIDRLAELGLPDVLQYHEYARNTSSSNEGSSVWARRFPESG